MANESTIQLAAGSGRFRISLLLHDTGSGLHGFLGGGDKAHVGGVVLALPRPSLSGRGVGVDSYIIPVPGHKDTEVARPLAEKLARALNQVVVISAGIHLEKLTSDELVQIEEGCGMLATQALAALRSG
ncbi:Hypothetical protein DEACI_2492 [Acididesulfobacillus acetoxydans]|uniref:Prenylated flavin chaperone LpdD-like domain-containing protein n=1 Tax=Acididesulfobacillus acetoxydans TaxID=1561005 RepID=A0A8S0VXE2_9FIRM|nr:hypothetical protein [Acididesulfobacillus acetoxydans]CAA7601823.1 Hypothetical protein DEACI_2492 [Acididesulfobacillus acetoxydans]CEJ09339.1 Hypothetical protein DEACI_3823 [Acididesulfobacillus acetoxydans]